jgi:DNA-binding PadR family transcriptional regulator
MMTSGMERRSVRPELLKGHLDLMLLAAVRRRPSHGYAIVSELRQLSRGTFDLPEGTIYPALYRLERASLLASAWSTDGARRRRVYRLTPEGERMLARYIAEWEWLAQGLNAVLEEAMPR